MSNTPKRAPSRHRRPEPRATRAKAGEPQRKELKYYGVAACLALWRARPDDVIRIYVTDATLKSFSEVLKWAARERKAYHVVTDDDLERLTESVHHQGVCMLALELPAVTFAQMKKRLAARQGPMLLAYLDGVENPHNLGAIVRTCAHFGVDYLLGEQNKMPRLSPSACRVAEGGAEHIGMVHVQQAQTALKELQALGFAIVTTAMQGDSVYTQSYPDRVVLVMGAEVTGVSKAVRALADRTVTIPGTGSVESLNVSVAFALLAGEFARQKRVGIIKPRNP